MIARRLAVLRGTGVAVLVSSAELSSSSVFSSRVLRTTVRCFDVGAPLDKERGYGHRMKDIPVLTGNPRPVAKEPGWICSYRLTDRMIEVVPDILLKNGWTKEQADREVSQIFMRKQVGAKSSVNAWSTVEEFQRTPMHRRYRPSDTSGTVYISYECMKLLEETLIPPSLRTDPYLHLRKRHLEDHWMYANFTEESAKYIRKEDLDKRTKGSPHYGAITRKTYLDFKTEFYKTHGAMPQQNEAYNAWLESMHRK